jgi:hypothetical protein
MATGAWLGCGPVVRALQWLVGIGRRAARARVAAWAGVALALTLMATVPAMAQERIKVEADAQRQQGYGRLILTFKEQLLLPEYVAKTTNGVLVLEFQTPIDATVDRVPLTLSEYVTIARRDPDGKGIRIALARGIRVNTIEAGEKLFVDFLPPTWQGMPPALPAEIVADLAKRAATALQKARDAEATRDGGLPKPKLDFRVGRNPTFARFSFGWNLPFDTQFAREGDRVIVQFSREASLDPGPIRANLPPGVIGFETMTEGGRLKVTLTVEETSDVRGFRDGNAYIVDVTHAPGAVNPAAAAVRNQLPATGIPLQAREQVVAPGVTVPVAINETPMVLAPPVPVVAPSDTPAPSAPVASPDPAAPPVLATRPDLQVRTPTPAAAPTTPVYIEPAPPAQTLAGMPVETIAIGPDGKPLPPGETPQAPQSEGRPPNQAVPDAQFLRVEARRFGNTVRVVFPFREPVASAAFKRGASVWLVFDSPLPMDTRALRTGLGSVARDVTVTRAGTSQAVRIDLADPLLATMGIEGNSWILSIGDMIVEPARPLAVERFVRTDGRLGLRIGLTQPGKVHAFTDPTVGDRISVVTAFAPARGVLKPFQLVDLSIIQSAHGVAAVASADDVYPILEGDRVVFGRDGGLHLSSADLRQRTARLDAQSSARRVTMEDAVFGRDMTTDFLERLRSLEAAVAAAPEDDRTRRRLELARHLIANHYASEALGVLNLTAKDDPKAASEANFKLFEGAAEVLAGRAKIGMRTLGEDALIDSPDAALWRTLGAVQLSDWQTARENSMRGAVVAGTYPLHLQAAFGLAAARAAIELNDLGAASGFLSEIDPSALDNAQGAEFEMLQARIADASGRPEDALVLYERVIASTNRAAAAESTYRRTSLLVRDGKMTNTEAIDALHSITIGWRGDEIELMSLRSMANLMVAENRHREAFVAMKAAVIADTDAETTRLLQDEMQREFAALFLENKADKLDPVKALSLYYDFREMTPVGRLGDDMVRKLADRLISVDLLPQAAEVLNHQVENRLRGAARSQIAADLAVVYLLDGKPEQAIAVLNKTRQAELPASLERQRRVVEARALSDAGRSDLALEVLGTMDGQDVERLRSDILWKAQNWRAAGEARESLLGGRWSDPAPLDPAERMDVLKAAIAYSLGSDPLSLDRLRGKFAAKMANSPEASAFEVVTAPITNQGLEFRAVARDVAAVDTMKTFLDDYRRQYLSGTSTDLPTPAAAPAAPPAPAGPEAQAPPPAGNAAAPAAAPGAG